MITLQVNSKDILEDFVQVWYFAEYEQELFDSIKRVLDKLENITTYESEVDMMSKLDDYFREEGVGIITYQVSPSFLTLCSSHTFFQEFDEPGDMSMYLYRENENFYTMNVDI